MTTTKQDTPKYVICFIDDDLDEIERFENAMKDYFTCITGQTHTECKEKLEEKGLQPDLWVLDLFFPVDGHINTREQKDEMDVKYAELENKVYDFKAFLQKIKQDSNGGIELLRKCLANYQVPVIMLTRKGTLDDAIRCKDEGAFTVLKKPMPTTWPISIEGRKKAMDDAMMQNGKYLKEKFLNAITTAGQGGIVVGASQGSVAVGGAVAGSVIMTGDSRNIVISESGVVAGRDISLTPNIDKRILSQDQAFERIGAAVRSNFVQLEQNMAQSRQESSQFFKLTLPFAGLGFSVLLVGVGLLLAGQVTAAVVSFIAGLIPEITAILFFQKDKELRATIERYHQQVLDSQRILTMVDVAETVKDGEEQDSLKRQIIYKALGIDNSL